MNVTEKYLKLLRDSNGEVLYYDKKSGVISLLLFLLSTNAFANTNQQIEVFDCQKEMVIQKQSLDPVIQKKQFNTLNQLLVHLKLKCRSKRWLYDKIPLSKPVSITNQWLHTTIDEVLILLPLKRKALYYAL